MVYFAAKRKSDKSYNPAKGAMYSKWEKAARDAEETLGLNRGERLAEYLVTYGSQPSAKTTPKAAKAQAKIPAKSPAKTPARSAGSKATTKKMMLTAGEEGTPSRRRPGPASKTGLARSPTRATGGQFPAGWRIRDRAEVEGGQTFISPDGREFQVSPEQLLVLTLSPLLSPLLFRINPRPSGTPPAVQ